MKVNKEETVEYCIVLSKQEAVWLKEVMQNPLTEDETGEDMGMRTIFWNALDQAGAGK